MSGEVIDSQAVARMWQHDASLWKPRPEDDVELSNRLGWLTLPEDFLRKASELKDFATKQHERGITSAVVCGMGGSSLAPEVFRLIFPKPSSAPTLLVLDSTDPGAVRAVDNQIDPEHTLFLISSKSGGTLEVMSFLAHFWDLADARADQFCAVTDPGTSLDKLARERGFQHIFLNPTEIGGRYSALSYFGLVPAAVHGIDLERLLTRASAEQRASHAQDSPGATLGAFFGTHARAGRDKLTLLTSPRLNSFGLWVEQLIAESTGKEGTGIVPIVGEPLGEPDVYGADRCFVALRLDGDDNAALDRLVDGLQARAQPVLSRTMADVHDLGAEMYCWEIATALAGYVLRINPFDQPNVQESKDNTNRVLQAGLSAPPGVLRAEQLPEFLAKARPGDYVAIQAYLTPSPEHEAPLQALRSQIRARYGVATTLGFGPRFLHSTGQLHKGGPPSGVFVQITDTPTNDVPIPGMDFTFGTLLAAQALGDLQSLQGRGLRAARIDLDGDVAGGLDRLLRAAD